MVSFILRKGAIFGAVLTTLGLTYRLVGFAWNSPLVWVFYAAIPVAVVLALRAYGRSGRRPGWLKGLAIGVGVTVVASFLYSLFTWGYNVLIDDSLIQAWREGNLALAEQNAKTPEELEQYVSNIEGLATPLGMARAILFQMSVTGAAASLIVTTVLRFWPRNRGG